jgi:uncharacterized membrane protein
MDTVHLIFGPQITGVLLVMIGVIMSRFPPKHINSYYGYRMPSAMKNQQTWDEANRYSAVYMIKAGFVTIAFGVVITALLVTMVMPGNVRALISIMSMMGSGIVPAVFLIVATEKHLTKTFPD